MCKNRIVFFLDVKAYISDFIQEGKPLVSMYRAVKFIMCQHFNFESTITKSFSVFWKKSFNLWLQSWLKPSLTHVM